MENVRGQTLKFREGFVQNTQDLVFQVTNAICQVEAEASEFPKVPYLLIGDIAGINDFGTQEISDDE